ncbi:MAG TPA: AI-2E family transporter [Candidatus Polarisedimenticolia bacterium]|nr:AI-2E family transporter [Candidatus Polarisedimenticolia bacterium]
MSGLRTALAVLAVVLALAGIYLAGNILVPFLLSAVIAYVMDPAVSLVERRTGASRQVAIVAVMAALVLVLAGMLALAVPEMISQMARFHQRLPDYAAQVRTQLQPIVVYVDEHYPGQVEALRAKALESVQGFLPTLGGWVATGALGVLTSVVRLVVWTLTIVVIPVFAYYLLADPAELREAAMALVPKAMRPGVVRQAVEVDRVLRAWVRSQLTVALLLAVIYSVGLTVLGVPLGLLIGVVGGLANMVPYLGLVVGFLPAALLAFLDGGSWLQPLLVAGVFILGQVLEGTVISPRVMGSGLGLPPALVLLAVLVGGELFGFTGLLLAVPTTAAAIVLLKDVRRQYDRVVPAPAAARRPLRRRRPLA